MTDQQNPVWETGWDAHERAQLQRLALLPLSEKLRWLEEAHAIVLHLHRRDSHATVRLPPSPRLRRTREPDTTYES